MKKTITVLVVLLLVFSTCIASASALSLPEQADDRALENSRLLNDPDFDPGKYKLQVILHYAKGQEPQILPIGEPLGYGLIGFKLPEDPMDYKVDTSSFALEFGRKISPETKNMILNSINLSSGTWDAETDRALFSDDAGSAVTKGKAGKLDGVNLVEFGQYRARGVIAVTYLWTYRDTNTLAEFDMIFDVDFNWGYDGSSSLMDIQNIGTHEFGHVCGLEDLYDDVYNDLTMYGYSTEGELYKRTLEQGDRDGLAAELAYSFN